MPSHTVNFRKTDLVFSLTKFPLRGPTHGQRGFYLLHPRLANRECFRTNAALDVASAVDVINDLGLDTLTFLAVTVIVVPAFKIARASPVSIMLLALQLV